MQSVMEGFIKYRKATYKPGMRVELVEMDDPYRQMPPGLKGTVTGVDDAGTIHVNWDNGSSLGCVETDIVKIVEG